VPAQYPLLDSPPLASPDAKGIRILLESSKAGSCRRAIRCCSAAIAWVRWKPAPLMRKTHITYQLFINAPNDRLVTTTSASGKTAVSRWI
jgi:paraquat-inducible protein B